jgi:hypothetical protein
MRYLKLIILVISFNVNSQLIVKGTLKPVFYKSGSTESTTLRLVNGETIVIRFKQFTVDVVHLHKDFGEYLLNITESDDWTRLQACEYDFDKDGVNEIIIAYGDCSINFEMAVFKRVNKEYKKIGDFSGQEYCSVNQNIITIPYGFQGLFFEYKFKDGKFIQTVF